MRILITGGAGFIGFHLIKALLIKGNTIVSIDNLNSYYDTKLKFSRLAELEKFIVLNQLIDKYEFIKLDMMDRKRVEYLLQAYVFARSTGLGGGQIWPIINLLKL